MRNAVEILRDHGDDREAAGQALSVLDRKLNLMVRLVDDLLDISAHHRGKIDLVRRLVDLDSVLQKAIECTRPASSWRIMNTTTPPPLSADLYATRWPARSPLTGIRLDSKQNIRETCSTTQAKFYSQRGCRYDDRVSPATPTRRLCALRD
jgi:signal transduction histidine kinase